MVYACTGQTQKGARCRGWAQDGKLCTACQKKEGLQIVGEPDAVEYKFNVNQNWVRRLTALGVEIRDRSFAEKEAAHLAHAEKFGREGYRYREDVVDSGVPVFGPDGLTSVSVYELFLELIDRYEIVDIFMRPTKPGGNQNMKVLVIYFSHGEKRGNTEAIEEVLNFLSSSRWGHCHIWANPPGGNGKVKCTVNISHREPDLKPEQVVRFSGGLWSVEPATEVLAS